jgi:two-component system sensor histidine kinase UhpB
MWKSFSLPVRLGLLMGSIFLVALIVGAVALRSFAVDQLIDENQPAIRSAGIVAGALNNTLAHSAEPERTLDAFIEGLGHAGEALRFEKSGDPPPKARTNPPGPVPNWFARLIGAPAIGERFPILIRGQRVGELLFEPDITADIFEKWIGFLSLAFAGIGLTVVAICIGYVTLNRSLHSLRELANGLTRLRQGDYSSTIVCAGAPEIRKSCDEVNALARTLTELEADNRRLLRKIVSLQDDERRDVARELHDELGPLLFGIRANSVALLESTDGGQQAAQHSAQRVMDSAEALQQANRKILDRLRPLHIEELGLDASIQSLVRDARSHLPELRVTSDIAPSLKADSVVSQTIYRVIQESVTNVLRHAKASELGVRASSEREHILVEVSDDGIGMAPDVVFGRGLTGMRERVRALGGTLQLARESGRTFVRCRLPAVASE